MRPAAGDGLSDRTSLDEAARARLLLAVLGITWGTNWPAIKIALSGFTPWQFRLLGFTVGALTLMAVVKLTGRSLRVPFGTVWVHLFMSSLLNVIAFGVFSTFAMLTASTGRVAMVAYSFPAWASLLAWLVLGDRLARNAVIGLILCLCGLFVLIYPVLGSMALLGLVLALGSAITWAIGTIYLKLYRIPGDAMANTAWQIAIAAVFILICMLIFEGVPTLGPVPHEALAATIYNGVVGSAVSYLIWYNIVGRLPAATAALGSLAAPVIGVITSAFVLGEIPTAMDVLGFSLIFGAALSVILQPRASKPPTPAPEVQK
jgi:drug/metabolite transporter (DMT)-like permease